MVDLMVLGLHLKMGILLLLLNILSEVCSALQSAGLCYLPCLSPSHAFECNYFVFVVFDHTFIRFFTENNTYSNVFKLFSN